jgi:hypothetical protein
MLGKLLSRRAEIVVQDDGSGGDYKVIVSGAAEKGGNAGYVSLNSSNGRTVIDGSLGPGNKDNFIIGGQVESVEGSVSVSTREVLSADYSGVLYGFVGVVLLAFVAKIYS